ncbi:TetR family transcriptional regulator [Nocardioides sp. Root1257]|uniref:TetR/AcrR family transcriptional regulator n=1 Tax=unclassified Nocardioides TaxID=2615069 RepID=UPI0006FB857A|nr:MULTISPECIES: TetR/AcrR family transcriptional regulator [unclassified Nocardioides]KQW47343.1 TetR family transcriptional regulator [Nocardioides sp. Root1257]KRC45499.1 TetR family transcriptional regulator [Nocardioides sp. Root224]
MPSLRDAQKQMTRRLLLESGLTVFQEKGYAAATIDDIATGAGTTRTTFYLHFPSKPALMQALIVEINESLVGADDPTLEQVVESGDRELIRGWISKRFDQWPDLMPKVRAANQAAGADPEIELAVEKWFESAIGDIHRGLDKAKRFDKDSRHVRGVLAFAQVEFLSRRWMLEGWDDKVARDVALDTIVDSWCSLLVT